MEWQSWARVVTTVDDVAAVSSNSWSKHHFISSDNGSTLFVQTISFCEQRYSGYVIN